MTRRRLLLALALVIVPVRVAVVAVIVPDWERATNTAAYPDRYPALAAAMAAGEGFGFQGGVIPTTARGPGFPAWLAIPLLLGVKIQNSVLLGLWSSLPGLIGALIVAELAYQRLGAGWGAVAGLLCGLYPLSLFTAARCMSDEFYGTLAIGAAALLWSRSKAQAEEGALASPWRAEVPAGLLLAWHVLTRPIGIVSVVALLLWRPLWTSPRSRPALLLTLALLPPALWSVRTSVLEGRPVFVQSLVGYNFWIGEAYDRYGAGDRWLATHTKNLRLVLETAGIDPAEGRFWYGNLTPEASARMERALDAAAIGHVLEHPADYARRCLKGLLRFWYQGQSRSRTLQYMVVFSPLVLFVALGALVIWRTPAATIGSPAVALLLLHNVAYAMTLPVARMSVQVMPFAALLVAAGGWWLAARARRR